MGKLFILAICGVCLSLWAIIQLSIMGWAASIYATSLFHDAESYEYIDYDDFIRKVEINYEGLSRNCYLTAICYVGLLAISVICYVVARSNDKKEALLLQDDEFACTPKPPKKSCFNKKNVD